MAFIQNERMVNAQSDHAFPPILDAYRVYHTRSVSFIMNTSHSTYHTISSDSCIVFQPRIHPRGLPQILSI